MGNKVLIDLSLSVEFTGTNEEAEFVVEALNEILNTYASKLPVNNKERLIDILSLEIDSMEEVEAADDYVAVTIKDMNELK